MRLIDADVLEKKLERLWNIHDDQDFCNKDVWREIENAHTIEPERTAKVPDKIEAFYSGIGVRMCGHCDQCGYEICDDFRYCPSCGAKLDWNENE